MSFQPSDSCVLKTVFLGESGTGKTSIVLRYASDKFSDETNSTIGASFLNRTIVYQGKKIELSIWDTAGQEAYRGLMPMYYRNAVCAIIVFDVTKRDSFDSIQSWIDELKLSVGSDIIIILCGNKIDLQDERKVTAAEAQGLAEANEMYFLEVSAKAAVGIDLLFQTIVKIIAETKPELIEMVARETNDVNLAEKKVDTKTNCC